MAEEEFHFLLDQADDAMEAYLMAVREDTLMYTDKEDNKRQIPIIKAFGDEDSKGTPVEPDMPYILIASEDADERFPETGNMGVTVGIEMWNHSAETPRAENRRRAGALQRLIFVVDLAQAIQDLVPPIKNFTAQNWTERKMSRVIEDNALVTRFQGTLVCFSSDS